MRPFKTTGRPLNGFAKVIDELRDAGMIVLPRNMISTPDKLRQELDITADHYTICGFMGHRYPVGMEGLAETVYLFAKKMGQIENDFNAGFAFLSGGGMPDQTSPQNSGLMGQWARGLADSDAKSRFLTKQELVEIEGLPRRDGKAIMLQNLYGEARYGARTDGLLNAADQFVRFPGGVGSSLEDFDYIVSASISPGFSRRKYIFVAPLFTNPKTGETKRFMAHLGPMLLEGYDAGLISKETMRTLNENCIVYRPAPHLSADTMSQELVSLSLSIRQAAVRFAPNAGYEMLPPALTEKHIHPFLDKKGGSSLAPLLERIPCQWDWFTTLRDLHGQSKKASPSPRHERSLEPLAAGCA